MKSQIVNLFNSGKEVEALAAIAELRKSIRNISFESPKELTNKGSLVLGQMIQKPSRQFHSVSNKEYTEISEGIFERVISSKDDIRFDFEKTFSAFINEIDFSKGEVLFLCWNPGARFDEHFHRRTEKIHCLGGSFRSTFVSHENGNKSETVTYIPGDTQETPPMKIHDFIGIKSGFGVVELFK